MTTCPDLLNLKNETTDASQLWRPLSLAKVLLVSGSFSSPLSKNHKFSVNKPGLKLLTGQTKISYC